MDLRPTSRSKIPPTLQGVGVIRGIRYLFYGYKEYLPNTTLGKIVSECFACRRRQDFLFLLHHNTHTHPKPGFINGLVKWPEQEDDTIHDNNTSLTIEREREREIERSIVAAAAAVVPQELGSLCKALGFASIKVVCGGANNKQASKQASASANVLMMLKRGGREEGGSEGVRERKMGPTHNRCLT